MRPVVFETPQNQTIFVNTMLYESCLPIITWHQEQVAILAIKKPNKSRINKQQSKGNTLQHRDEKAFATPKLICKHARLLPML